MVPSGPSGIRDQALAAGCADSICAGGCDGGGEASPLPTSPRKPPRLPLLPPLPLAFRVRVGGCGGWARPADATAGVPMGWKGFGREPAN